MQNGCFFLIPIPRKFKLGRRASLVMQAQPGLSVGGGGGIGGIRGW